MENIFISNGDQLSIDLVKYENKLDENQLFGIQAKEEFIQMNQYVFNDQNSLNYDLSQVVSLNDYLSSLLKSGESNHFKGYAAIIKQIVNIMLIGDKLFFASPKNIVLEIDKIFVSLSDRSLKFMYFPFTNPYNVEESRIRFGRLMESFYPYLGDSSDSLVLQSRVMQFLKNEDADFRVLNSQLDKWEAGIAGESKARNQANSQSKQTGTISDIKVKKDSKTKKKQPTQSKEVQSMVKTINPKVIISIILVQVVIIAIIGLIYASGALVDADTGNLNITQFIGASLILAVLLEYVMFKAVIENKNIYIEKVKTTTINYGGDQVSNNKSAKKPKKVKEQKPKKPKKSNKKESLPEVEELETAIEGTDLLVDPLDEMEESKTTLLDDIPVSAFLHIQKGTIVQKFEVKQAVTSIGRKAGMVCVVQEKSISGHHATLHNKNGVYYIEDENSTNHTFINGTMLEPKNLKRIESNDHLKLANVEMTFTIE